MAVFKDANGKEWIVKIHAPLIAEIQSETDKNLRYVDGLTEVLNDPVGLFNVLWVIVRGQATAANVSSLQFGEALVGDAFESAAEALVKAYRDFSPASTRKIIDESMKQAAAVEAKRTTLQLATLEQNYKEMNVSMDEALRSIQSPNATDSPELSASVPTA